MFSFNFKEQISATLAVKTSTNIPDLHIVVVGSIC